VQTANRPLWSELELDAFPTLDADRSADAVIVGGGITGLSTAVQLAEAGLEVVVLERNRVGSGTTGSTTAHLTEALDVDYHTLVSRFGADTAGEVARSSRRAIDEIERRVAESGRSCGFARLPGYRLAENEREAEGLEREAEAARSLGVGAELVDAAPVPFRCQRALRFAEQAQFHPLAYLQALAERVIAAAGSIYEHAPVAEVEDDGVELATGPRVSARHVIDAAHTPVGLVAGIQTRITAFTSYVLCARLEQPLAEPALCWDCADPYHYVRTVEGDAVLIGGEDHRTGRERNPAARHAALEAWARARFPVRAIEARWSHELFEPADGLPYIGLLPGSRSRLVAAGFSGTGMTFGTVASLLLRDLVVHGESPWARLYSPSRLKPLAAGLPMAEENLRIGWRFVADRLTPHRAAQLGDLPADSGRVERLDGKQVAVYRDLRGDLHLLSARCTHMGCIVAWNDAEKTWDCPCHGGRFHPTGKVLYGPPTTDLPRHADDEPDEVA
jgi:glycine/D-amino acid oxidase-like deaminating enzyme/nitrite reductase/ring-hydroxylating ferredoxin subunit